MAGNKVYVQGHYVDVHDNEVVNISIDKVGTMQVGEANVAVAQKEAVPALLDTPRARELWQKAMAQGWVDAEWQPLLSRPMAALLADRMAEVMGIATKWKAFEQLWRRKNMRNDYNTALTQQQCDDYMKKIKRIIS